VLGVAHHHERVPRDYVKNLKFRRSLLDQCEHDPDAQAAVREACRTDILFWINVYAWQYNPKKKGRFATGPFITWPFQERAFTRDRGLLWCYWHDRTAVVEKSREMGASWMFLLFEDWLALFHDNVQAFNLSRSADAVDDNTRNSLFEKIRYVHAHLPGWMLRGAYDVKHFFGFPATESEIAGEASTGRSGSGGRASVVFVDEFPEIKEAQKVRQNTASIADTRFFNGTHLGVGTEFHDMVQTPELVHLQFHWTRHPDKNKRLYSWDKERNRPKFWQYVEATDAIVELPNPVGLYPDDFKFDTTGKPRGGPHPGLRSPWYDWKCVDIGHDRGVCMELDIDPAGAASQFYSTDLVYRLMQQARETPPLWRGDLVLTPSGEASEFVKRDEGELRLWVRPFLDPAGRLLKLPPSRYTLGLDLGWGQGATPSVVSVFDLLAGRKVGRWSSNKVEPKDLARWTYALCWLLVDEHGNPPLVTWEAQGPGASFTKEFMDALGYRKVFYNVDDYKEGAEPSDKPGWNPTPQSKLYAHTEYQKALRSGKVANHDEDALKELLAFTHTDDGSVEHPRQKRRRGGDPSEEGVSHGDLGTADVLMWRGALLLGAGRDRPQPVEVQRLDVYSIAGRRLYLERQQALAADEEW
jgi:hypothetical protein